MNNTMALQRDLTGSRGLDHIIGVLFFISAMALGAYVRIPLPGTPVPMTLQTLFVMLSGAILGKRLGLASQALYIFLGVAGLPVFQGYGAGAAHLFGPTGGYLAGFALSSYLTGVLLKSDAAGPYKIAASFIAGAAAIYGCGIAWLMALYRIPFADAIRIGLIPFIAAETVKISAAAIIYRRVARRSKSIFS